MISYIGAGSDEIYGLETKSLVSLKGNNLSTCTVLRADGQTKDHTPIIKPSLCSYIHYLCNPAMISYIGAGSDEIYRLETKSLVKLRQKTYIHVLY